MNELILITKVVSFTFFILLFISYFFVIWAIDRASRKIIIPLPGIWYFIIVFNMFFMAASIIYIIVGE